MKYTNTYEKTTTMEFFKEKVTSAIKENDCICSEFVEFYIVNLLDTHVKFEKMIFDDDNPLIYRLYKASDCYNKYNIYKELGDFTLFITGIFPDCLNNKLITPEYYSKIGTSAYRNISSIMDKKLNGDSFFLLFKELADNFYILSNVLTTVSNNISLNLNKNKLYEKLKKQAELDRKVTNWPAPKSIH